MRTAAMVRWAVPFGVAGVVAGVALLPSAPSATANPALPARSASQLLADLAGSSGTALSGTVVQTARLGLPELPAQGPEAETGPLATLSGSHTVKVWVDGPQRQRLALISQLAEYNVIHNGRDVWTYTSRTNKATHTVLPARAAGGDAAANPRAYPTPGAAADAVLRAVQPTTAVTVDRTARVAGRPAYQLVLRPRDSRSLVTSVRIALDSTTKVPLRVSVWGSRSTTKPAWEVGFTDVRFSAPAASVFTFVPPPGASVTSAPLPAGPPARRPAVRDGARVVGTGWAAVLVVPNGASQDSSSRSAGPLAPLVAKLTTPVSGGRVLSSALVSVLFADDGRVLVGAVAPAELTRVAATAAAR